MPPPDHAAFAPPGGKGLAKAPPGVGMRIRVLLLGDSGVGKSSFAYNLVHGEPPPKPPQRTVGCNVLVKINDAELHPPAPRGTALANSNGGGGGGGGGSSSASGTPLPSGQANAASTSNNNSNNNINPHASQGGGEGPYFVELWDVTGSARFAACRHVFFRDVNGVLLFHDLTNRRSRANLHAWEQELAERGSFVASSAVPNAKNGLPIPTLVVGTKLDVHRRMTSRPELVRWLIGDGGERHARQTPQQDGREWGDLAVDGSAPLDEATRGALDHFFYELMMRRYGSPRHQQQPLLGRHAFGSGEHVVESGMTRLDNLL